MFTLGVLVGAAVGVLGGWTLALAVDWFAFRFNDPTTEEWVSAQIREVESWREGL